MNAHQKYLGGSKLAKEAKKLATPMMVNNSPIPASAGPSRRKMLRVAVCRESILSSSLILVSPCVARGSKFHIAKLADDDLITATVGSMSPDDNCIREQSRTESTPLHLSTYGLLPGGALPLLVSSATLSVI